jgi:hypothetical protein
VATEDIEEKKEESIPSQEISLYTGYQFVTTNNYYNTCDQKLFNTYSLGGVLGVKYSPYTAGSALAVGIYYVYMSNSRAYGNAKELTLSHSALFLDLEGRIYMSGLNLHDNRVRPFFGIDATLSLFNSATLQSGTGSQTVKTNTDIGVSAFLGARYFFNSDYALEFMGTFGLGLPPITKGLGQPVSISLGAVRAF